MHVWHSVKNSNYNVGGKNRTKENDLKESNKMEHNFAVKAFWVFHDFPSLSLIVQKAQDVQPAVGVRTGIGGTSCRKLHPQYIQALQYL